MSKQLYFELTLLHCTVHLWCNYSKEKMKKIKVVNSLRMLLKYCLRLQGGKVNMYVRKCDKLRPKHSGGISGLWPVYQNLDGGK